MKIGFYLRVAFHGLKQNKLNSFVAVSGMAIAFTCLLFALSWIKYELSYDTFYKNSDRVYQVNTHFKSSDMVWRNTPFALSEKLKTFSEIESISLLDFEKIDLPIENEKSVQLNILKTDTAFYEMFPQLFLIGNANGITPVDIILTKDFVERNWGTTDVIGKHVGNYIIKGVVETPPSNSNFPFDALVLRPDNEVIPGNWGAHDYLTFIRLTKKTDEAQFLEKLKNPELRSKESDVYFMMVPLNLVKHLIDGHTFIEAFGSYVAIVVALVLMFLSALFNFIMLTTARCLSKLKMYAIHKSMGASSWQIVKFMYAEISILLVFIFVVSAYLVELCHGFVFSFLEVPLGSGYLFAEFIKYMLICSALVYVWALYPVVYIRFLALKKMLIGGTEQGGKGKLNTWLIGVQLTVTIILVLFIGATANQFSFMTKEGLGFTVENIGRISIESDALRKNIIPFINDLKANKAIKDIIWSDYDLFRSGGAFSSRDANDFLMLPDFDADDKRQIFFYPMKADVLAFFDVALVEGRYFDGAQNEAVVSEQLVEEFGVKDIVGQIKSFNGSPLKVVGIIKDFHLNPMTEPVRPAAFVNSLTARNWGGAGSPAICYFKYYPDKKQEAFAAVREAYAKHSGEYVPDIQLFSNYVQQFYRTERNMLVIFSVITCVSILISMSGLFALILFKLHHRRKEIALRKIQGASAGRIMYLLMKEYIVLIFVSVVISFPIVYFSLDYWLSQYQSRAAVDVFSIIGILLLIAVLVFLTIIGQVIKTTRTNPVEVIKENN